ncbi:hypothetical protein MTR_4g131090 [Medicago truncatula]|uniref:Uncharacterized protein n=1 Tax=Medicago truncatula TaxID=3880 RepID=G7JGS1_MEDTR|nr:hypothetical protein MTR_4g131090 [Medicago truncatula]
MVLAYGFAAGFVLGVVRFEIASSNLVHHCTASTSNTIHGAATVENPLVFPNRLMGFNYQVVCSKGL